MSGYVEDVWGHGALGAPRYYRHTHTLEAERDAPCDYDCGGAWVNRPEPEHCGRDLASMCPVCVIMMEPEHAHLKCPKCGWRDSCCF